MKFAHIADTHIKNLKYHKEYRAVFKQLYETLKKEKVDYIIHCGDIAHTKTQISPEFVELCSDFLKKLANIAPTYVILGNHDGNLRNSYRQDAITPIVEALGHSNLHLLKNAGETHLNKDFCLNVLSVFDEDNWVRPTKPEKINIGLYHGAVKYSRTDIGFVMEHGEHDISIFDSCDYAFLGDIHKTQDLNKEGTIAYAGSTIQQNFGETNDKGIYIWDIESKTKFTKKKINFNNPKPFITINLTKTGRIPNKFECQHGARLRLVSNSNIPLEKLRRACDIAKHRFKPESITFLSRHGANDLSVEGKIDAELFENLRDEKTQQELIKEYLMDFNPSEETLDEVYALNSRYNKIVEENEDVSRNVHWKIKKFSWDNLFNYGEGNSVNFDKLSGTVGIFGKNFSGKSSIVDSLLYTIYNNTSKNIRKTYNIINQNKGQGSGVVEIKANNKTYTISRKSEKYVKKLKGKTTNEARTQADFDFVDQVSDEKGSLNQTERGGTDKAIRNVFGSLEDFLTTSMASQMGAMNFINEGSTRRKEILAKFLDLEFFERKFKYAKEDVSDLRGALKRVKDIDYDEDIKKVKKEIFEAGANVAKKKNECSGLKDELITLQQEIAELHTNLSDLPDEIIHIKDVRRQLLDQETREDELIKKIEDLIQEIGEKECFLEKSEKLLSMIDIDKLNSELVSAREIEKEIDKLMQQKGHAEKDLNNYNKQTRILHEIPCSEHCPINKYMDGALKAEKEVDKQADLIRDLEDQLKLKSEQLGELDLTKIETRIENYNKLSSRRRDEKSLLMNLKFQHERMSSSLIKNTSLIEELTEKIRYYEGNKELLENTEKLYSELECKKAEVEARQRRISECDEDLYSLIGTHGALEQKLENLENLKTERDRLSAEYSAHHLFLTCMHSSGIAFDVIKRALPIINDEITKVLSNVVDFQVFFENNDNKLDIQIKHPKHEPRPLENGSGAEKTLAAIAIRIALLNVSNMPKSNLFILDEPGTALDPENMEGFMRILELVKGYFDVTLLITHIESLKDTVDMTIDIMKTDDGYAYVNQ